MVVFSEVSPCRLDRNAPEMGEGGSGVLTTDPKPGRHIPADSATLHPHHPENIKHMFYKRSRNLLLRLREV
jgi:hypothetical protein